MNDESKKKNESTWRFKFNISRYSLFSYSRRRLEEMKLLAEQERQERLAERQRRIEAGEILEDEDEEDEDGADEKGSCSLLLQIEFCFLLI